MATEIEGISVSPPLTTLPQIEVCDHRFKSFKPFHDQLIHRGKENHVYGSLFTYTDSPMHLLVMLHATLINLAPLSTIEQQPIKPILEPWLRWVKQQSYNPMEQ